MGNGNQAEGKLSKKEVKMDVVEFCAVRSLDKYYMDSFKMSYGDLKKTAKEWERFLISKKMIKEEVLIK